VVDREWGNPQRLPAPQPAASLIDDLCRHVQQRFSDRIPAAVVRALVTDVVARWRGVLNGAPGAAVKGLRADANRVALAWLRMNNKIASYGPDYDDRFTDTVFGGGFDAAAVCWGIHALVQERRIVETLILTQYVDMAELNGRVPSAREVLAKLKARGRGLSEDDVHNALVDFHGLLRQAP